MTIKLSTLVESCLLCATESTSRRSAQSAPNSERPGKRFGNGLKVEEPAQAGADFLKIRMLGCLSLLLHGGPLSAARESAGRFNIHRTRGFALRTSRNNSGAASFETDVRQSEFAPLKHPTRPLYIIKRRPMRSARPRPRPLVGSLFCNGSAPVRPDLRSNRLPGRRDGRPLTRLSSAS